MVIKIDYDSYYFDVAPFIEAAKALGCWVLVIVGARDRGKTYSTLKYTYENNEQIIFLKRQVGDISLLCLNAKNVERKRIKAARTKDDEDIDLEEFDEDDDFSPYADLNEDLGINVQPKMLDKEQGIATFYDRDIDTWKAKKKVGIALAVKSIAKYKGFGGLRKCKYLVFDEFIPAPWERGISKLEGESVVDLYSTISRDREQRGQEALLMICLANANDLSNQMFNTLEITDDVVDMINHGEDIRVIGRKLVVLVDDSKLQVAKDEKKTLIYQDMKDTMWGRVSFNNEFARNDISCIGFTSIKKMICRCSVTYKNETWYVYQKDEKFYVCASRSNKIPVEYDLNFESTRKPFYLKEVVALVNAYHKGNILFAKFRMYDVIIHFKKFFEI
ncbi:MAG: hypothetical protein J6W35_06780 [Eubacterium sp.]|nr:hypothetical protein [Eubacterium sp.]